MVYAWVYEYVSIVFRLFCFYNMFSYERESPASELSRPQYFRCRNLDSLRVCCKPEQGVGCRAALAWT
jgi:hypothetical protein